MPNARTSCFVDTNTLLYSRTKQAEEKRARAREWIEHLDREQILVISPQVMNEYCSVVRRKMKQVPVEELELDLRSMEPWCKAETSATSARLGLRIHARYGKSFYDSVLLASAILASCGIFLSEDMNDGQNIEGVRILNPFRHGIDTLERLAR